MTINIVISGPASVGKSRLLKYTTQKYRDLRRGISHTTRPLRTGETNGEDYHFIAEDDFTVLTAQNYFAFYKKNDFGYSYGISGHEVEVPTGENYLGTIFDLDPDGFQHFKNTYKNVIGIYLLPDSLQDIKSRLRGRHPLKLDKQRSEFEYKLNHSIKSLMYATEYDYVFFNKNIISVAHQIHKICELYSFTLPKEDVKQWQKSQIGETYDK